MIRKMRKTYSIDELCETLGIARSGFYRNQSRSKSKREEENRKLIEEMGKIHRHRHRKAYGSPRMTFELKDRGFDCSVNRVARLMKQEGLRARARRPFRPKTTQSDPRAMISPNRLADEPPAQKPGQQLVSDITYIPTKEGWLYLSIVQDLYSRAILGWDLSDSLAAEGVTRAIKRALKSGWNQPKAIFHSDRGCQYSSKKVRRLLNRLKLAAKYECQGLLLR